MIGNSVRISGAVQHLYELSGKPYNQGEMHAVAHHYMGVGAYHTACRADIVELVLDNGTMTTSELRRLLEIEDAIKLRGILEQSALSPIRLGILSYREGGKGRQRKYFAPDAHKGRMYVALMRQLLQGEEN